MSTSQNEVSKAQKTLVLIGCCIHVIVAVGFSVAYTTAMSLLPGIYGIGFDTLGVYTSIMAAATILGGLIANSIFKKIKLKGALLVAPVIVVLYLACLNFIPGKIGLLLALVISGFMSPLSGPFPNIAILNNWYGEKSAGVTGIIISAMAFGLSLFFAVAGIAFDKLGFVSGMNVIGAVSFIILVVNIMTLLRKTEPDGYVPYVPAEAQVDAPVAEKRSNSLLKNPVFYLSMICAFFASCLVGFSMNYSTVYLTEGGLSQASASTVLSVLSFVAAAFSLVSGKLLEKIKFRKFMTIILGCAFLCNVFVLLFIKTSSVAMIVGIAVMYAVGYTGNFLSTYFNYEVFTPEDALNVNTKSGAACSTGEMIFRTVFGIFIASEALGFRAVFFSCIGVCVLTFAIYLFTTSYVSKKAKASTNN